MGKGHRDNHRARKKRGAITWSKRSKRRGGGRSRPRADLRSWIVNFKCGKIEAIPLGSNSDINEIAIQQHSCSKGDCKPIKFIPQ